MPTSPLMLTQKDDELLGVANRSDAMGLLPVWSLRARDLVPHLTEQTTSVRGFQLLVEIFRLWELYEPAHPEHAGRLDDFFVLVEQAFARTVGWHDGEWPLPGARRVRARSSDVPHISLKDQDWHLLGGQKANGLWGLYRGASRRAGLLEDDMKRLSDATLAQATVHAGLGSVAQSRLFAAVKGAMDGRTVELPTHLKNSLPKDLRDTMWELPLAAHLAERLIDSHPLNQEIARRLLKRDLDHRAVLTDALILEGHRSTIEDVLRCENLLSVVEAVFLWLCASKGASVEVAVDGLPVDLDALGGAREQFGHSGHYGDGIAATRHTRLYEQLDTSSHVELARSVLALHEQVSRERKRAAWVWEEHDVLRSDVDVERPGEMAFQVELAWRNDYYLYPLQRIAEQLVEVRS